MFRPALTPRARRSGQRSPGDALGNAKPPAQTDVMVARAKSYESRHTHLEAETQIPHSPTWKSQIPSSKFQRSSKFQIPNGPAPNHSLGVGILSLEVPWDLGFWIWDFDPMRINNSKHVPWIVFVFLATIAACLLYVTSNFHPARLPSWIHLPASLIQKPTEHHTVGGTPLGLWFGSISLAIFIFAALLSLRKKIPLWRVGTVQRWLRAHIWLTILTIPLPFTCTAVSGWAAPKRLSRSPHGPLRARHGGKDLMGLVLRNLMPRLMKERLPAETVFEQIPHIRAQLCVAAEKMRDSFKPTPPKKPDAGAPAPSPAKAVTAGSAVMASTKGELSTPVARAKSVTGSVVNGGSPWRLRRRHRCGASGRTSKTSLEPAPPLPLLNAAAPASPAKLAETIGTPTDPPLVPSSRRTARCSGKIGNGGLHRRLEARPEPAVPGAAGCSQTRGYETRSHARETCAPTRLGIGGGAGRIHRAPDAPVPPRAARQKVCAWAMPVLGRHVRFGLNCTRGGKTIPESRSKKSRAGATSGACSIYRRVSITGSTPGFSFMCRFRFCC